MLRLFVAHLLVLSCLVSFGQSASERGAVRLTATVQPSTPSITLSWAAISNTSSFTIQRKSKESSSWGSVIASPAASALQWTDNSVSLGVNYEYKVVRVSNGVIGTGYISTGIQVPVAEFRGKLILLVDNTLASQLVSEIDQLIYDLKGDGWTVLRSNVSRTASVTSVRAIVQAHYNSDPTNVKGLYLLGHIPVPYSGDVTPDGHDIDRGARPTDGYYADVNGTWTDVSVTSTSSPHAQAHNVPGDGKFDQGDFPSPLELQVGRVDMYNMPAFADSEVQLMRNYLNKAHSFKVKGWEPTVRSLLIDNVQWLGNPIAGSSWRTAPMAGPSSPVPPAPVIGFNSYVNGQSYLWTGHYGGGSQLLEGGVVTYNGIDGSCTTQDLAGSVLMGGVFNMTMGSYFYDFDNRNNFLRAMIARGDGLTNVWAGIPAWYFHHMGMGDNIGYSTFLTMNNAGLYTPITEGWQSSIGRTHMSLMGDPSLRMKMIVPPTALVVSNSGGHPVFTWTASTESVIGYHVYQFEPTTGSITRLTTTPVTGTSYTNPAIPYVSGREYMVRAVKLETNYSGSFYNQSLGALATSSGSAPTDCLGVVGGTALVGTACNDNNPCTSNDTWNASCQCVGTGGSGSATITPAGPTSFCSGGSVVLNANTASGSTYVWRRNGIVINGATASSYTASLAGTYTVIVTNGGCSTTSTGVTVSNDAGHTVTFNLSLDRYGAETTWQIRSGGATFASGGPYTNRSSSGVYPQTPVSVCLAAGCYELVVNDTYGDGICCAYGSGSFSIVEGASTLVSGGTFTYTSTHTFCVGSSVLLNAQVMLEGPYGTGPLMSDALRAAGSIPTTEPYTALGYAQSNGGGETVAANVLSVTGSNAIVDWVLVELHSGSPSYAQVASRCALLQRDGDIVEVDGSSPVRFSVAAGNYHVVVHHRNHLGVMTTSTVALSSTATTVNFKAAGTSTYGTNPRKSIGTVRLMWAGDASSDGQLMYTGQYNDRDLILSKVGGVVPTNTVSGYWHEDVNMNGVVSYTGSGNDRDIILQNIGGVVPTNTLGEQVP